MLSRLRKAGIEPQWQRVETAEALREALAGEQWQVALVDFSLPGFGGLQALAVLAELAPDVPAITVSGAISEETAVATISAGAVDYILKDNLTRLAPAVLRAVEGAELRARQRQAAAQARQTQFAIDHSSQAIVYVSEGGVVLYANEAARSLGGRSPVEVVGEQIWDWVPLLDEARWAELWRAVAQAPIVDFEAAVRLPGGEERLLSATLDYHERDEDPFVIVYARDITAQREVEERAQAGEERYERLADNAADIIFRYDLLPTARLTYINRAVEVITGHSPEEHYADPQLLLDIVDPGDVGLVRRMLESPLLPDEPMLMRWIGKDGLTRWMESRLVPVRDAEGRLVAVEGITRDISERRRAEQEARLREMQLRTILESTADGILAVDGNGTTVKANRRFADLWKIPGELLESGNDEALLAHVLDQLVDPDAFREKVHALYGSTSDDYDTILFKDGKVVERFSSPMLRDGVLDGRVWSFRDVTERNRVETELRESEALYRSTLSASPDGIAVTDLEGRLRMASPVGLVVFGYERMEEALGRALTEFMVPEDRERAAANVAARRGGVFAGPVEYRGLRTDGSTFPMEVNGEFIRDAEGRPTSMVFVVRDITERRRAEDALRESEQRLHDILFSSVDWVWETDENGVYTYCSQKGLELFGPSDEDVVGKTPFDFMPADEAERVAAIFAKIVAEKAPIKDLENWNITRTGERVCLLTNGVPMLDAEGNLKGYRGVDKGITERKQADEALRESEERFEGFAGHFPGYLFMEDEERRYVYVNRPEKKDGEVLRRDWLGKTPSQVWEGDDALRAEARIQRALDGEVLDFEERWSPPGLHEYLHTIYFPISRAGKPPLVGGLSIDVTAQHEAEEEVRRQAQQLRRTVEGAVLALGLVVETRDPYTAGHERRVSELATAIAADMGMVGEALEALRLGGLIHDIGKIAVPAEILSKPGLLSEIEFNLIKQHPAAGFEILGAIDFGLPVAEMVLQHHERLDGSGYPKGLAGKDVLPQARILAVADVVEAMSSHRPYRAALGMEAALAEVRAHAGVKYDAEVVTSCVRLVKEQGFAFTP